MFSLKCSLFCSLLTFLFLSWSSHATFVSQHGYRSETSSLFLQSEFQSTSQRRVPASLQFARELASEDSYFFAMSMSMSMSKGSKTSSPTNAPFASLTPSDTLTLSPSTVFASSQEPSNGPTDNPTNQPSHVSTLSATAVPSIFPVAVPSKNPITTTTSPTKSPVSNQTQVTLSPVGAHVTVLPSATRTAPPSTFPTSSLAGTGINNIATSAANFTASPFSDSTNLTISSNTSPSSSTPAPTTVVNANLNSSQNARPESPAVYLSVGTALIVAGVFSAMFLIRRRTTIFASDESSFSSDETV